MKMTRWQKIYITVISIVLAMSLLLNIFALANPVSHIVKEGYGFFSMIRYALLDNPLNIVEDSVEILNKSWALEQENELLRQQVEAISSYQAKIVEQQQEIESLKEMNGLNLVLSEYETIPTTILSRSYDSWHSSIVIDVGSDDGVKQDFAVMNAQGLVGRIQSVSANQSVVSLLTKDDSTNKVSVKIWIDDQTEVDAILEYYDHNEGSYVMKLLESNHTVTAGMSVTTSGLGGVFPSGILVGKVVDVEELVNAVGVNVYVTPSVDFQNLDYLHVVSREGSAHE